MKVLSKLLIVIPFFALGFSFQKLFGSDFTPAKSSPTDTLRDVIDRKHNPNPPPVLTREAVLISMRGLFKNISILTNQVVRRTQGLNQPLLENLNRIYERAKYIQNATSQLPQDDSARLMNNYIEFTNLYRAFVDATVEPSREPRAKTQREFEVEKMDAHLNILRQNLGYSAFGDWLARIQDLRNNIAARRDTTAFYDGLAEFYSNFNFAKDFRDGESGELAFPQIARDLEKLKSRGPSYSHGDWRSGLKSAQFTQASTQADGWRGSPQDRPPLQELKKQAPNDADRLGMSRLSPENRKPGFTATKGTEDILRKKTEQQEARERRALLEEHAAVLAHEQALKGHAAQDYDHSLPSFAVPSSDEDDEFDTFSRQTSMSF